ncbi:twin-arginine translocation signal domain-containing protein [candidate division KSB1 bacterium]|nr:twin-arginine translocation signal domain-containing protein [candidate division KSB1 bacterium]
MNQLTRREFLKTSSLGAAAFGILPNIKAINWYDFSDFRPYIVNGGLVREDCSTKLSFQRLKNLLASWKRLPRKS